MVMMSIGKYCHRCSRRGAVSHAQPWPDASWSPVDLVAGGPNGGRRLAADQLKSSTRSLAGGCSFHVICRTTTGCVAWGALHSSRPRTVSLAQMHVDAEKLRTRTIGTKYFSTILQYFATELYCTDDSLTVGYFQYYAAVLSLSLWHCAET